MIENNSLRECSQKGGGLQDIVSLAAAASFPGAFLRRWYLVFAWALLKNRLRVVSTLLSLEVHASVEERTKIKG